MTKKLRLFRILLQEKLSQQNQNLIVLIEKESNKNYDQWIFCELCVYAGHCIHVDESKRKIPNTKVQDNQNYDKAQYYNA